MVPKFQVTPNDMVWKHENIMDGFLSPAMENQSSDVWSTVGDLERDLIWEKCAAAPWSPAVDPNGMR